MEIVTLCEACILIELCIYVCVCVCVCVYTQSQKYVYRFRVFLFQCNNASGIEYYCDDTNTPRIIDVWNRNIQARKANQGGN